MDIAKLSQLLLQGGMGFILLLILVGLAWMWKDLLPLARGAIGGVSKFSRKIVATIHAEGDKSRAQTHEEGETSRKQARDIADDVKAEVAGVKEEVAQHRSDTSKKR